MAAGEAVLAPSTTRRLLDTYSNQLGVSPGPTRVGQSAIDALTARETEVFTEMAAGLSNKEIAVRLYLSETTVKTHVVRILSKLRLRDRVQAVIFAYENGITLPSPTTEPPPR